MSYPIPDLGQRPPLHAEFDELAPSSPTRAELDERGQQTHLHAEFGEPGSPKNPHAEPGSPKNPHAELDEPGSPTHPHAELDDRLFEAVGLLSLIPPPAQQGEPDRLRDRKLDSAIADRAAREAYAQRVVGSVCRA